MMAKFNAVLDVFERHDAVADLGGGGGGVARGEEVFEDLDRALAERGGEIFKDEVRVGF